MIKIDSLTVQFGGIRPLDALDAQFVAPICGLIGPNGAGKTTLLNVLSGFVTPIEGTILLDDAVLLGLSPRRRVSIGLRRTFQQELVADELTAKENIQAVADHVSADRDSARREVGLALDFVGLGERRNTLGRQLNLFERRMVEIAKTLIGQPKVILMDEPGAGLNESETDRLRRLLVEIPSTFNSSACAHRSRRRSDRLGLQRDAGARFWQAACHGADPRGARRPGRAPRLSGTRVSRWPNAN